MRPRWVLGCEEWRARWRALGSRSRGGLCSGAAHESPSRPCVCGQTASTEPPHPCHPARSASPPRSTPTTPPAATSEPSAARAPESCDRASRAHGRADAEPLGRSGPTTHHGPFDMLPAGAGSNAPAPAPGHHARAPGGTRRRLRESSPKDWPQMAAAALGLCRCGHRRANDLAGRR